MNKPAILHICLSKGWGGLEMYPLRTSKELIQRGYSVYSLCLSNTQVAKEMKKAEVETFEISSKVKLITSQLFNLNKWLNQRNISVIHCHKSGDLLISALLSLITKRKTFFTEHMGGTSTKRDFYHKWIYTHIDQVFSISNETYKRNIKTLPIAREKISCLWLGTHVPLNPIENTEVITQIKKELCLPNNSVIIGNIGRVCLGKGQMELLEAFALLVKRYSYLNLLLVGGLEASDGSDSEFVFKLKSRIKELCLEERVYLAGFRRDTDRMLSIMDIVCLPNHNEAFGLTAIEAMAAQKAIVGSETGAFPEILGSTALLCNPKSPQDIASKLESYIVDKNLLHQKSNLAYDRAQQKFSIESHINTLTFYYQS